MLHSYLKCLHKIPQELGGKCNGNKIDIFNHIRTWPNGLLPNNYGLSFYTENTWTHLRYVQRISHTISCSPAFSPLFSSREFCKFQLHILQVNQFLVGDSMSTSFASLPKSLNLEIFERNRVPRFCYQGSRRGLKRRDFAFKGIVTAGASMVASTAVAESENTRRPAKLEYKPEGYYYWTWRDWKIHYVVEGEGLPVVLIHGFGASAFHWRYNIPELAKKHKVYAVDLLGFGWSEKAITEYDALVWRDQIVDFVKEIVKEPAVLVGNSLGGFTALVAAAALQDQVKGVVLLNTAGQFSDTIVEKTESEENALQKLILNPLKELFQRVVLGFLFWQAKQPARIQSVLKSVYINSANVDDYLIESITKPATDPNAGEVYYRLMSRFMSNQRKYTLDSVLSQLHCPLLLIWGDKDPWVGAGKARRIKEFYGNTQLVSLPAGHCPHDEVPELVNAALIDWLSSFF